MTVQQFKSKLLDRMAKPLSVQHDSVNIIKFASDEINRMTGGAFYRSLEKLPDNYFDEFPT